MPGPHIDPTDETYPEKFDSSCGIPAWIMREANMACASLISDRERDVNTIGTVIKSCVDFATQNMQVCSGPTALSGVDSTGVANTHDENSGRNPHHLRHFLPETASALAQVIEEIRDASGELESESFDAPETARRWVTRLRALVQDARPESLRQADGWVVEKIQKIGDTTATTVLVDLFAPAALELKAGEHVFVTKTPTGNQATQSVRRWYTSDLQVIDDACETMELHGMHNENGYRCLKALHAQLVPIASDYLPAKMLNVKRMSFAVHSQRGPDFWVGTLQDDPNGTLIHYEAVVSLLENQAETIARLKHEVESDAEIMNRCIRLLQEHL